MEVFLIAATTADGYIGRYSNDKSTNWTSKEDKQFYISKIKEADVIVMGSTSFDTFDRYPKDSNWVIYDFDPTSRINPAPDRIKFKATKAGPQELLEEFKQLGYQQVAICGGKSIYTLFMTAGLVDRLYLTVEPVIFGSGIPLFDKSAESQLELEKIHQLSKQTIVLQYKVLHELKWSKYSSHLELIFTYYLWGYNALSFSNRPPTSRVNQSRISASARNVDAHTFRKLRL